MNIQDTLLFRTAFPEQCPPSGTRGIRYSKTKGEFVMVNPDGTEHNIGAAASSHTQAISTVDGLQTALDTKIGTDDATIVVKRGATDALSGTALLAAYAAAKALTPGGSALSATNRAKLLIPPGTYLLASTLSIDTSFVDIEGLGSYKLDRGCVCSVLLTKTSGALLLAVSADDVRIKGISTGPHRFAIVTSGLDNLLVENCIGSGPSSFGVNEETNGVDVSGTFVNCIGGDSSFGYGGLDYAGKASGKFYHCVGGEYAFGGGAIASGEFINCLGGFGSFAGYDGNTATRSTASGTFLDCDGSTDSFAGGGTASGTFTNCTAGGDSLGAQYLASGTFKNCKGGHMAFGGGADGRLTGTLDGCEVDGGSDGGPELGGPLYCEGATIRNSRLKMTATNGHCLVLVDGNTVVENTTLLVNQGENGVPIYAATAQNVVAVHCRMNNASKDADGLGANVTNLVSSSGNVVSDAIT